MKYRKKPIVVEALQYDGVHTCEINKFVETLVVDSASGTPFIHNDDGYVMISKDDYVIKGVNGECYRCKPDVFEKLYDVVVELDTPIITATQTTKDKE